MITGSRGFFRLNEEGRTGTDYDGAQLTGEEKRKEKNLSYGASNYLESKNI